MTLYPLGMIVLLLLNGTFLQVTVTLPLCGFNAIFTTVVSGRSNSLAFYRLYGSRQFISTSVLTNNCWPAEVALPLISLTDVSTMKQPSPERCVVWGWDHILAGLPLGAFCSFAYITGHFCNTDWGDGAGVLFEQSITLFHTCLQSMNGKLSFFFYVDLAAPCNWVNKWVIALRERVWDFVATETSLIWIFRATIQNF